MSQNRRLADWLASYKYYMAESESPMLYHQWSAISALAGAVRRNVWMDFGYFNVYPNLYVVLVGPPAIKKTTAMNSAKRVLKEVGPRIKFANDSTTREKLIDSLTDAYIGDLDYSAVSAFSPEFGNMLQSSQAAMIDFLTGIYDYDKENFIHGTVGRGERIVVKPYFNLIACTTPGFVNNILPSYAIGTGFVSRLVCVYADKPNKLVPIPEVDEERQVLRVHLVEDLRHISTVSGEMKMTDEARAWYEKWYKSRRKEIERADVRLAGYVGRKPILIVKLAMILSLSQRDDLIVTVEELERALSMVEALEPGMRKLFCSVGRNIFAPIVHRITEQLANAGDEGLTFRDLLMMNIGDVDAEELSGVLMTARALKLIVKAGVETIPSETNYKVTKEGLTYVAGNWSARAEGEDSHEDVH